MKLSQLGEFGLIRQISKNFDPSPEVLVGIGDDCAAVKPKKGKLLLFTCDPSIEGIHFTRKAKPFDIGWKVMARNISDIAAMGGTPKFALVAASLPRNYPVQKALEINRGVSAAAKMFGISIIGGDTSHDRHVHLTVTLVGEIVKNEIILRKGAKPGDYVCVTGTLGGSIFGKHLAFTPRVREARFLARRFRPTSMMDISDGLASDLERIREQSQVGFEIWANKIPIAPVLKQKKISPHVQTTKALSDGEDYELLFTVKPATFKKLMKDWRRHFNLPLTNIGVVRSKAFGIQYVVDDMNQTRFPMKTKNDHFKTR